MCCWAPGCMKENTQLLLYLIPNNKKQSTTQQPSPHPPTTERSLLCHCNNYKKASHPWGEVNWFQSSAVKCYHCLELVAIICLAKNKNSDVLSDFNLVIIQGLTCQKIVVQYQLHTDKTCQSTLNKTIHRNTSKLSINHKKTLRTKLLVVFRMALCKNKTNVIAI